MDCTILDHLPSGHPAPWDGARDAMRGPCVVSHEMQNKRHFGGFGCA